MRLEQHDSYLTSFDATVTGVRHDRSEVWLALDRSAFYPTAGGQPHDTGELGDARVVDVVVVAGEVWHRIEGPAPAVGERVGGSIDWDRRYRHMQRHSAQHLLSQAFVRVSPALATRSVSLRGADCSLDLAADPTVQQLARAQAIANDFGYRNLQVTTFEVDEAALTDYPLRRPAKVHGRVRLVAMGDVELAACGGTHLARTAEALPIVLLGSQHIRGGLLRVTFRAGWEAVEQFDSAYATLSTLVTTMSAPPEELPSRVRQLQTDLATAHTELARARAHRAQHVANELVLSGTRGPDGERADGERADGVAPVVRAMVDDALLDDVADRLQQHPRLVALLASRTEARTRLAFVHGPGRDLDLRPALRAALAELGGRGGGRPERAQGAGPEVGRTDAALDAAEAALAGGWGGSQGSDDRSGRSGGTGT